MYGGGGLVAQSCPAVVLATPWTVALQIPLSMGSQGVRHDSVTAQQQIDGLPW